MLGVLIFFIVLISLSIICKMMDWLPTIMGIVLAVTGVFMVIYLIVAVLFIILEKV